MYFAKPITVCNPGITSPPFEDQFYFSKQGLMRSVDSLTDSRFQTGLVNRRNTKKLSLQVLLKKRFQAIIFQLIWGNHPVDLRIH